MIGPSSVESEGSTVLSPPRPREPQMTQRQGEIAIVLDRFFVSPNRRVEGKPAQQLFSPQERLQCWQRLRVHGCEWQVCLGSKPAEIAEQVRRNRVRESIDAIRDVHLLEFGEHVACSGVEQRRAYADRVGAGAYYLSEHH